MISVDFFDVFAFSSLQSIFFRKKHFFLFQLLFSQPVRVIASDTGSLWPECYHSHNFHCNPHLLIKIPSKWKSLIRISAIGYKSNIGFETKLNDCSELSNRLLKYSWFLSLKFLAKTCFGLFGGRLNQGIIVLQLVWLQLHQFKRQHCGCIEPYSLRTIVANIFQM